MTINDLLIFLAMREAKQPDGTPGHLDGTLPLMIAYETRPGVFRYHYVNGIGYNADPDYGPVMLTIQGEPLPHDEHPADDLNLGPSCPCPTTDGCPCIIDDEEVGR